MERTRSLTTKGFLLYKVSIMVALSIFILAYAVTGLMKGGWFGLVWGVGYPLLLIIYWFPALKRSLKKLKEVSYDSKNLYVHEAGYEIQIPFHQVKDVEIVSLDGLYKFKLHHSDQFGNGVMCKPSIWYPFNYRKVDRELDRIRSYVRKAHREYQGEALQDRSLPSN